MWWMFCLCLTLGIACISVDQSLELWQKILSENEFSKYDAENLTLKFTFVWYQIFNINEKIGAESNTFRRHKIRAIYLFSFWFRIDYHNKCLHRNSQAFHSVTNGYFPLVQNIHISTTKNRCEVKINALSCGKSQKAHLKTSKAWGYLQKPSVNLNKRNLNTGIQYEMDFMVGANTRNIRFAL